MNEEEVIYGGIAINKVYDQTEDDVLNQHLYFFGEDMGTMREIKNYKQQVMEQTEVYCNPPRSGKTYIAKLEKDNFDLQQQNKQLQDKLDEIREYCDAKIIENNQIKQERTPDVEKMLKAINGEDVINQIDNVFKMEINVYNNIVSILDNKGE